MAKLKKKAKVKSEKSSPLFDVRISEIANNVIGNATILAEHAGCIVIRHKKPRSSKFLNRVIPRSDITYLYAAGEGEAEVHFNGPALVAEFSGRIKDSTPTSITFEDEDGVVNTVTFRQNAIIEAIAEADDAPAKKKPKAEKPEKSGKVKKKVKGDKPSKDGKKLKKKKKASFD